MIRDCHLDSQLSLRTLRGANTPPDTDAVPRVAAYLEKSVLCALSGPFDELKSALLPAIQGSLWDQAFTVISASSVSMFFFL